MAGPDALFASHTLTPDLEAGARGIIDAWETGEKISRLWDRDASLWTGADEHEWLGWLNIVGHQLEHVDELEQVREQARRGPHSHVLLLGMGGSSLCADVLTRTFGLQDGFPVLLVLDSTDPAQIRAIEQRVHLGRTLFVVASKSGTTLEPDLLRAYFSDRAGPGAAERFMAITDPRSRLDALARNQGYRRVFSGIPDIGGRFSALSHFGMVPAALMGLDVRRLLESAAEMQRQCSPEQPLRQNPAVELGAILGAAAALGRDKLTLVTSPEIGALGGWLEQLIAESTGKQGRAIIPIVDEPLGQAGVYGDDRLFVHLRLRGSTSSDDAALAALARAGQPVARIELADPYDLGAELLRWELATSVASVELGINPFDQPDVEASKIATRELTTAYVETGALPDEEPVFEGNGIRVFAEPSDPEPPDPARANLAGILRAHLQRLRPSDYFAALAFVQMDGPNQDQLQRMRLLVRDAKSVATSVGFGPRFLHSTGQAHKGGPNTGVFLQITCADDPDLPVPGRPYGFGLVKAAQARGDLAVLAERGRRTLRVDLGSDVAGGLARLTAAVAEAVTV